MGQGEPVDFAKPLEKTFRNLMSFATLGALDPNTGEFDIKKNVIVRAADETLGEITGRNMARKAGFEAKDALEMSKAQAAEEKKRELERKKAQDTMASQVAGSMKEAARAKAQSTPGVAGYQGPVTDFLGL